MNKRKICVVTGSRAEYGLFYPILITIQASNKLELKIISTSSLHSTEYGLNYKQIEILTHPMSYLHAIVKFNNGLSKLLVHDTNMIIPIFNSIYFNTDKKLKSKNIDIETLNNLNLKKIDNIRFPVVKILNNLDNEDSLFETIIVISK